MAARKPIARSPVAIASLVWLNLEFWTLMPLVTVLFIVLTALCVPVFALVVRDRRRVRWLVRRSMGRYGVAVTWCTWPLVRVRFVDRDPGSGTGSPAVIVANHRASSDAFLMACLPIETVQVVNNWPVQVPVFREIGRIAGYLPVKQMSFAEFVRRGSQLLADGVSIIAFPEGTRSGSTRLGPFHGSAFRLAQQAEVDIIPVAIAGNENIPSRRWRVLFPGRIVVSKLPAVTPDQYRDMSPYTLKTLVRDRIQAHLELERSRSAP